MTHSLSSVRNRHTGPFAFALMLFGQGFSETHLGAMIVMVSSWKIADD